MYYPATGLFSWFHFAENAAACGLLVSLALICLIQYLLHTYYVVKTQRKTHQFETEITQLTAEREDLQQGQRLTELENRILRDFLSSSDVKIAGELLLKHFAPNPARNFAALLFVEEQQLVVEHARGLSKKSLGGFSLELGQLQPLIPNEACVLQETELRQSELWAKLSCEDRSKADEIILLPICKGNEVFGVLMTTELYSPSGTPQDQLQLALRLMGSISGNFRQRLAMKKREHEFRQTKELLQLRSITDATYDGPLDMVKVFLQAMQSILEADSVTLYFPSPENGGDWKPMVRCDKGLPPGCLPLWEKHEVRLLNHFELGLELKTIEVHELRELGIETLLKTALLVSLQQEGRVAGIFCIARRRDHSFEPSQRQLVRWAAEHLGKTLARLQSIAEIKLQAKQDGLTELANRRTFDEQLEREIRVAQRASVECSLLLCDLDQFKAVNDTYGHLAGDEVLRIVARILNEKSSQTPALERALTARYGGEEMAIILPGQGEEIALSVAEEIRNAVFQQEIWWQKMPIHVTISIGVATFPANALAADSLIAAADEALYLAKSQGRNRVCFAGLISQAVSAN